ncbi:transposase [Salinarimonas soli]|uniref:Transposase n=1 Tax=Salinarimonas soli TaxID=1638099 RepID=A0A5B2VB36_9HYPH|nr:transposase [Salinarimonas soli]
MGAAPRATAPASRRPGARTACRGLPLRDHRERPGIRPGFGTSLSRCERARGQDVQAAPSGLVPEALGRCHEVVGGANFRSEQPPGRPLDRESDLAQAGWGHLQHQDLAESHHVGPERDLDALRWKASVEALRPRLLDQLGDGAGLVLPQDDREQDVVGRRSSRRGCGRHGPSLRLRERSIGLRRSGGHAWVSGSGARPCAGARGRAWHGVPRRHQRARAPEGEWSRPKEGPQAQRNVREALVRSRGGFGTKACVIADGTGPAVAFTLAPGQAHELPTAIPLLDAVPGVPLRIVADRSYASHTSREHIRERGSTPAIPARRNEGPLACPDWADNDRNLVARLWARLKARRAVATRCETTAASFMGVLGLAAALDWIRR